MKQNTKSTAMIVISILLALSGMTAMAAAIPTEPHNFGGSVAIGGDWAAPETVVSAHINGASAGSCEVVETGIYSLAVNGNAGDITFKINDVDVPGASVAWTGGRQRLDLHIGTPPEGDPPGGDGDDTDDGNDNDDDDGNDNPGGGSPGGFGDSGTGSATTTTAGATDGESTTPGDGANGAAGSTSTESSDTQATDDGSEFYTDEPKGFGSWVLFILIGLIAIAIIVAYLRKR